MALAITGLQRIVGRLPIRYRLLAVVLASAALALLILSTALVFYYRYVARAQDQQDFAVAAIVIAIVALLAGFGLSTLLHASITRSLLREIDQYRTALDEQVKDRTAALSTSNEQLHRTIEELQTAKLQAEAASKAKSDFLASMSHELRTPLTAIIGFSDLMRSEMLGPIGNKTYVDYAADINFSGTHLLAIINDILDVVRHEAGKMELKEEVVDVEAVINEALRLIAPLASRGVVALSWLPPAPPMPPLFCDRVRVRQMLLNILSNAVKFTGSGGAVEISAELGDGMHLIVKDSGVGIKSEDIARIMTPFGQVASVYSRNQQGAGLGLTLTKALIERHGGRLSLDSAPGVGTTVRLSFPAERVVGSRVEPDTAQRIAPASGRVGLSARDDNDPPALR